MNTPPASPQKKPKEKPVYVRTPARQRAFSPEKEEAFEALAKFYRGLGDPTRLKILVLLERGEKSVGELVAELKIAQGRVSSHLACLRWCGYVAARREKNQVYYSLKDARIKSILLLGEEILEEHAQHILRCSRI